MFISNAVLNAYVDRERERDRERSKNITFLTNSLYLHYKSREWTKS